MQGKLQNYESNLILLSEVNQKCRQLEHELESKECENSNKDELEKMQNLVDQLYGKISDLEISLRTTEESWESKEESIRITC
jgi:hypothetical protein